MIAPVRKSPTNNGHLALAEARRLAARMLPMKSEPSALPLIAAWKAWLFALWVVLAAGVYLLAMWRR